MLACSLLALALAASVVACDKKSSSPAGDDDDNKPKTDKKEKPAPDFASWDLEAKKKAWQGSWVVKDNGTYQAWTITDAKVQVWDGSSDKTYQLQIQAPCRAYFLAEGGIKFPHEFAVVKGKLKSRPGGAGVRKGAQAMFCDPSGDVYTVDESEQCTLWKSEYGEFKKTDGQCGLKKDDKGNESFTHKGTNEGVFPIEGDAILSEVSSDTESASDHADAKAKAKKKSGK
jgi:hypothetical protein